MDFFSKSLRSKWFCHWAMTREHTLHCDEIRRRLGKKSWIIYCCCNKFHAEDPNRCLLIEVLLIHLSNRGGSLAPGAILI